jgi:bifunctional non-homologous end joining protein LigD
MARTKSGAVLDQAPEERMPSRLEPMLAKPGHIPESDSGEWAYEIKWDGVRALGYADHGRWSMLSRRLEDVSARYPELAPIADALADHAAILDGEVVALDPEGRPRFQLLQSRMGLTSPTAIKARVAQTRWTT